MVQILWRTSALTLPLFGLRQSSNFPPLRCADRLHADRIIFDRRGEAPRAEIALAATWAKPWKAMVCMVSQFEGEYHILRKSW